MLAGREISAGTFYLNSFIFEYRFDTQVAICHEFQMNLGYQSIVFGPTINLPCQVLILVSITNQFILIN